MYGRSCEVSQQSEVPMRCLGGPLASYLGSRESGIKFDLASSPSFFYVKCKLASSLAPRSFLVSSLFLRAMKRSGAWERG